MSTMPTATTATPLTRYDVVVSVAANGDVLPDVEMTVNGHTVRRSFPHATNHAVYYLAVIDCLGDALARQADRVDVVLGDTTATRQLNGSERIRAKHLRVLREAVRSLADRLPHAPVIR